MGDRLRSRDLAILSVDSASTPMHNATVELFDPGESGLDYQRLVELIAQRISFVPRYRQRLQSVPGHLANPIWVDDPGFELGYHVRRSGLPRPGTLDQLRELVARIVSRPLDRHRPLWEVYFVEGLEHGRVAVLSKSHQILVDGVETVDLGQVLLDDSAGPKELGRDDWRPRSALTPSRLVLGALKESVAKPDTILETTKANVEAVNRAAGAVAQRAGGVMGALASRRPREASPVNRPLSQQRRFVAVSTRLADYRLIRDAHGGTVNDVILATITGGLRQWLMSRAESLGGLTKLRAVVPMSVIDADLEANSLGTQIAPHHVSLPIGEPSPLVRLHQVGYSFQSHKETRRTVSAKQLAGISGFAPTTFHALGSRVAATEQGAGFHLTVTNVPGPQFPLYAAGARMVATFPVLPLLPEHAMAIGVTSYDGGVYYGVTADRDALPDIDLFAACLEEALDELLDATKAVKGRAPRGKRPPRKKAAATQAPAKKTPAKKTPAKKASAEKTPAKKAAASGKRSTQGRR